MENRIKDIPKKEKERDELKNKHLYSLEQKSFRWGYGEWIEEPDYVIFTYKDIKCEIFRNVSGYLCGYCSLPKNHPWLNEDYWEIECNVHGELTFKKHEKIGFDCAHSYDIIPSTEEILKESETKLRNQYKGILPDISPLSVRTYKNMEYLKNECKNLANQIIESQINQKENYGQQNKT